MNADFFEAIEDIEKEKGIPRGYMYDKIKQAMFAAFRRDNPDCEDNVEIILENLPYEHIRWIENEGIDLDKISGTSDMKKVQDLKGNPLLLFVNAWSVGMTEERNPGLQLSEFGKDW